MPKTHVFTVLFFLLCTTSMAQIHIRRLPFEWSLHAGASYFNAPSLNQALQEQDVSKIAPIGANISLGLGYRFGNLIVGGQVSSVYGLGRNSQFTATTPTAYVATNLFYLGRWIITPSLGFGPQFTSAVLEKDAVSGDFNDYLTSQSNQTRLHHTVSVLDLGITFKTYDLLTASYRPKFKVGYQSGLHQQGWKVGSAELANAPRDRTGIVYVQISVGVGR